MMSLKKCSYDHEVSLQLKHQLMTLLQKEIRLRITLDGLKSLLLEKANSDFTALFSSIDVYYQNVIDPDKYPNVSSSLLQFMIKHKGSVSENQLLSIFRRINKKADACITLQEFITFLCPIELNSEKILKKLTLSSFESRGSAKKPLISPVVRHLENERRSKSPLLKDISLLSTKNLRKETKNFSKRNLSPVRVSVTKSRAQSPQSRSPVRPTPTISARRENLVKSSKVSRTHQAKIQVGPQIDKSLFERKQLFKTEADNKVQKSDHVFGSGRKSSKSKDYNSAKKSAQKVPSNEQRSSSRKDLTISSYLEQRRAEFKTQRSDSKKNTPTESTPSHFNLNNEAVKREPRTEPTSKNLTKTLNYDEIQSSHLARTAKERIVDPNLVASQHGNRFSSKNSSGKKEGSRELNRDFVKKSTLANDSLVDNQRNTNNRSSKTYQHNNTANSEKSNKVYNEKQRERVLKSQHEAEIHQKISPSIIQLTPTKFVDSLEVEHTSPSHSRILTREKYSRSPISTVNKKSEDGHLVPGYLTGHSELSFSDRKTEELMAETPKFDSGVLQSDTVTRSSRLAESLVQSGPRTSDIEKLCMIFKKIIVFYERIEELKNQVHNEKDFSLTSNFNSFDFENKGFLTLVEFTQLFNSFGINIGRGEIVEYLKLILKRSSLRPESRLTETDLAKCFAPLNTEGKLLLYSSTSSSQHGHPRFEVKPHLSARLDEIVQLQIKLHCELIKEIKPIESAMLPRMFKLLADQAPAASWAQITAFLKAHDVKFFENDIIFIFREFNCRHPKEMLENEFLSLFRLYSTAGL
jgi:hypothetical protein